MTRKHFQAIADQFKATKPVHSGQTVEYTGKINQWRADVDAMARVCELFNDNFNMERFLNACGVDQ